MFPSARRLASTVTTGRFDWQGSRGPAGAQLVALVFPETSTPARVRHDSHPVEARELHLPSVAAERVEAIEQQAFDKGHARGQQLADVEMERRLDVICQELAKTIAQIGSLHVDIMRRADREMVHLAIAMAERILRRELKNEPELLLVMARAAIERLGERTSAIVHLNPADLETLADTAAAERGALDLVADPEVVRGGCVIRSAVGMVDAGLDAQIRELARGVLARDASEEAADGPLTGF